MAVYIHGEETYKGAVLMIDGHMWMDGMYEEYAVVWDAEKHTTKHVQIGYYGADGHNLAGGRAEVDVNDETVGDILETLKRDAHAAFIRSVEEAKAEIRKGRKAEVVKGRKVPKGTLLDVFWVGARPTYRSRSYSWMNETERIAGCFDAAGNKVWIKAEYLKAVDEIKEPGEKEREAFIQGYIRRNGRSLGLAM